MPTTTITQAVQEYIDSVTLARSQNTARTYRNALSAFLAVLEGNDLEPEDTAVRNLPEDAVAWFATALKDHSPATEALYLTAAAGFYEFLAAERLADPNLPRLRLLIRQRGRRSGQRLPQFPRDSIEKVLENDERRTHWKITRDISLRESSWIAVHTVSDSTGDLADDEILIQAHTAPVYVIVDNQPIIMKPAVSRLIERTQASRDYYASAKWRYIEQGMREKLLSRCDKAIDLYEKKLVEMQ